MVELLHPDNVSLEGLFLLRVHIVGILLLHFQRHQVQIELGGVHQFRTGVPHLREMPVGSLGGTGVYASALHQQHQPVKLAKELGGGLMYGRHDRLTSLGNGGQQLYDL